MAISGSWWRSARRARRRSGGPRRASRRPERARRWCPPARTVRVRRLRKAPLPASARAGASASLVQCPPGAGRARRGGRARLGRPRQPRAPMRLTTSRHPYPRRTPPFRPAFSRPATRSCHCRRQLLSSPGYRSAPGARPLSPSHGAVTAASSPERKSQTLPIGLSRLPGFRGSSTGCADGRGALCEMRRDLGLA